MLKKQFDLGGEINSDNKAKVANALGVLLASTSLLHMKTLNYHWNVTGFLFTTIHEFTDVQYKELAVAIDEIAERIRMLGFIAPGTYGEFLKLSIVVESNEILSAEQMIRDLILSHESVTKIVNDIVPLAENINDHVTLDLLTKRLEFHELNLWKLKVSILNNMKV